MKIASGVLLICLVFELAISHRDDFCFTNKGVEGTCGPLSRRECSELRDLIPHINNNTLIKPLFRANICRDHSVFGFCCPLLTPPQRRPDIVEQVLEILPPFDNCGLSYATSTRVYGGEPTLERQYPWIAALGSKTFGRFELKCGGTVITKRHILTATHCFIANPPHVVRTGEYDLSTEDDHMQEFHIVESIDAGFNFVTRVNDLMLVVVDRTIVFDAYTLPACLPSNIINVSFDNKELVIAGWGKTDNGTLSSILLSTTVPVVNPETCNEKYQGIYTITDTQICAGTLGRDTCKGDSGGPLMFRGKDRTYVVGITSFGHNQCGSGLVPGVYTRVDIFIGWIYRNIAKIIKM